MDADRARRPSGSSGSDPVVDLRPLVTAGDLVLVGSSVGTITALAAADGSHRWTSSAALGSPYVLSANATQVFASYVGGYVSAMNLITGNADWVFRKPMFASGEELMFYPPASDGRTLFQGGTRGLYAFRK